MIYILCASNAENLKSEMKYEPICFSIEKSEYEHELVNLNDSSTVSNTTKITTATPTIFYTSDRKSLNFQGKIFIFNCPMPKKEIDYFTQMVHWTENDTTITIVNGEEYISSEGGEKIYVFQVIRPQNNKKIKNQEDAERFNKQFLVIAGAIGAILAFYIGRAHIREYIAENPGEVDAIMNRIGLLGDNGQPIRMQRQNVRNELQQMEEREIELTTINTMDNFERNIESNRSDTRLQEIIRTDVDDYLDESVEELVSLLENEIRL